ncbi:hypothetical protein DFH06DRAFT_1123723 [Mycena polygramma]|nr:hypothetical protein DFH06DRAFT_1123723 [Mycena polygramma]
MTQPWYFVRSVFTDNLIHSYVENSRFALVCSEGSIIGSPVFKLKAARTLVAALKYLRKEVEFSPHFHRNGTNRKDIVLIVGQRVFQSSCIEEAEEYYDRHRHCLFMDPYPCMGAAIDASHMPTLFPTGTHPDRYDLWSQAPVKGTQWYYVGGRFTHDLDYALELSESGINEWPAIDVLVARNFLTAVKYLAEEKDFVGAFETDAHDNTTQVQPIYFVVGCHVLDSPVDAERQYWNSLDMTIEPYPSREKAVPRSMYKTVVYGEALVENY